jgi:hypothetical protein
VFRSLLLRVVAVAVGDSLAAAAALAGCGRTRATRFQQDLRTRSRLGVGEPEGQTPLQRQTRWAPTERTRFSAQSLPQAAVVVADLSLRLVKLVVLVVPVVVVPGRQRRPLPVERRVHQGKAMPAALVLRLRVKTRAAAVVDRQQ